jgi:hypothetical protein
MAQRMQGDFMRKLGLIGDLPESLGRSIELERPPVLVRKDEALVEIAPRLGREFLGGLRRPYATQNRDGFAIEWDLSALARLRAFEDNSDRASGAFSLLRPR